MKILITCIHYPVASGRYVFNALRRLGHEVHSFGPCTGNQIWGVTVDEAYVWIPDMPEKDWTPDLVIHMDGNWIYPERFGDMPHIAYGVDNHVRDYRHGEFDHLFLAHGHGYRMNEDNVSWLPCGYDPQWFTPGPPLSERPMDAAMIGWMYDNRAELLYALRERLPHLTIQYGLGALYEHYAATYQSAKLSLCRSYHGDVAQRIYETAAMGCVVLTDVLADAEAVGLEDGVNCRVYDSPVQCAEIIRELQNDLGQAERIAAAGQAWAAPHTWDARLQVIVEWASGSAIKDHFGIEDKSFDADVLEEMEEVVEKPKRKRASKPAVESEENE